MSFAGLVDHGHAFPTRKTHDCPIFRQTMHEQSTYPPVAGMRVSALEKRGADAAIAMRDQHGYAELGMSVTSDKMGDACEMQVVIENAE